MHTLLMACITGYSIAAPAIRLSDSFDSLACLTAAARRMISLGLVYPKAKRPESGVRCGGSNALQSIKSNLKELLAFENALSRRQRDVFDATLDQSLRHLKRIY